MLGLFISLIGIGLVIGIIALPFAGLFVILRGRKEFSCLSCGMLSRRYPPLSMGAGFRMRCGRCGQKTLIPSNSPAAQQVITGSVTPPVTPFFPPVPRPHRSKIALYLLLIFGVPTAIWLMVYAPNTPTSVPTTPAATTAEQAEPTLDNAPQTPQATDNEATQTPDETEEDKQLDLGWDAIKALVQGLRVDSPEYENLRFDTVVVMPDNTVCLSIFNGDTVTDPEQIGRVAFVYVGGKVYQVHRDGVTVDLWTRECVNQRGINVYPKIEGDFARTQQGFNQLEQQLHDQK